jgi:pimeloyl-ACP methyl ester carboxylesterase
MLRITTLFLVLFCLIFSDNYLNCQISTGNFAKTYTDRDVTSTVSFWVPADYDSTKVYPFLYAWHGAGDTGANMRTFITYLLAQRVNAILVCPDANAINGKSSDYFLNLINYSYSYTRSNYKIDTNKIIIMGFSWGGGVAYQLGLQNPNLFKGIMGLAPAIGQLEQTMWDNIKKIRMATILGDKDFNYTAVSTLMKNIQSSGGNLLYIEKPGVQHVDNTYFNSQAIIDDFRQCYDYIIGVTDVKDNIINDNFELSISPNPATDIITISFSNLDLSYASLKIFDSFGNEIKRFDDKELAGLNSIYFSIENYPSGIYYCSLYFGLNKITKSFVIVR